MKLPNYLPTIYEDNLEMQSIMHSENTEFENNLETAIKQEFDNNSVITANEQGIYKFEKLFSIVPDPQHEDLRFRKERILNRLSTQAPFTIKYLEQKLNSIIGEGNWGYYPEEPDADYINPDFRNYKIDIYITMPRTWLVK